LYKLSLEQNIAPLRSTNFSLNGNNNDLMDGVEFNKLLSFNNSNSNSSTNSTNLINTNLNNNISNKK
jgi:hypothetical protein